MTDLQPTEAYIAAIFTANPGLAADRDGPIVARLAQLRRLLDFHSSALDDDPSKAFNADAFQKLSTLALRHEAELGITPTSRKAKTGDEAKDPEKPIGKIRMGDAS